MDCIQFIYIILSLTSLVKAGCASQEAETRAWLDPEIQGQLEQRPESRQLPRCTFVVVAHEKLGRSAAQDRRTVFKEKKICLKWSRAVALFSFDFVRDAVLVEFP